MLNQLFLLLFSVAFHFLGAFHEKCNAFHEKCSTFHIKFCELLGDHQV